MLLIKGSKRLGLLFALLILLFLVGCSGNDSTNDNSVENNNENSTEDLNNATTNGGDLKIASVISPTSIAPAWELRSTMDLFVADIALEKLGEYTADGTQQPHLAEGWEEDPENLTITYELKQGIKFHDGTDFNADAVKWNIEQFLNSGRSELNGIQDIEVLNDYTLQIKLETWNSSMVNIINHFLPIYSPSAYEVNGADWAKSNPVGTGPFKIKDYKQNESIQFEKNTEYWQEGKPYLDSITIVLYGDSTTATASLQAGEVDAYFQAPALSANNMKDLPNYYVVTNSTGLGALARGVIANSVDSSSPFANEKVRRAVSYAIDRDTIVDVFHYGYATSTNQWGVPGSPTFNEDVAITYNPEKAKELLAEAGYANGFKTTYTIMNDPVEIEIGTAIQGFLKEVGIDVELNIVDNALFREITTAASNKPWDGLITYSSRGDYDLFTYMPRNFSTGATTYGNNVVEVDEVIQLFAAGKAAQSSEEVTEIAYKLQKLVAEEHALATFIYVDGLATILHVSLQNTGINEGHSAEWSPENAQFTK